jgi:hypothetical protein
MTDSQRREARRVRAAEAGGRSETQRREEKRVRARARGSGRDETERRALQRERVEEAGGQSETERRAVRRDRAAEEGGQSETERRTLQRERATEAGRAPTETQRRTARRGRVAEQGAGTAAAEPDDVPEGPGPFSYSYIGRGPGRPVVDDSVVPPGVSLSPLFVEACAACGERVGEDCKRDLTTSQQDVWRVFKEEEGQERQPWSARGVEKRVSRNGGRAVHKMILLRDLVRGERFVLCPPCARVYKNVLEGTGQRPGWWRSDFCRVGTDILPALSLVEKACIARGRLYGRLIKIVGGNQGSGSLSGHIIAFPQRPAEPEAVVLPDRRFSSSCRVVFLGPKERWNTQMMPQLCGRGGLLSVRPECVYMWLKFLQQHNSLYAYIRIDESPEMWERPV